VQPPGVVIACLGFKSHILHEVKCFRKITEHVLLIELVVLFLPHGYILSYLLKYTPDIGVWRSWLARTAGGREVAGSSPVTPTIIKTRLKQSSFYYAGIPS